MSFKLSLRFPGSATFLDYTDYVLCHDQAVATKKWQQDEKPTLEFWLGPDLTDISGMQIPVRGTEVHLDCDTYPNLFTGFVTTDQQLEVQGGVDDTLAGGVYGYKVDCTGEEILLDMQYVGNVQPFVNMTEGDILASLIQQLVPGRFDTSALSGWGDVQPYFAVTAQQKFSDIQKALLANKAAMLAFQRGVVTIGRYWDVAPYVLVSERGESYNPSDLNLQTIPQDIRNDLTGVGAVEPQAYVREYAVSDGYTGIFPLAFMPFGQTDTPMLSDDFTGGSLSTQTWTSYDPSDSFDAFEGSLNALGGLGYGLTFLLANLGLELKGKLRIKAGEFQFEGPCDGIVGVMTTVDPVVWNTMTNAECLAATILGWKFTPNGQNTDIQPIVNGALTGQVVTTAPAMDGIVPMTYILEMFFAAPSAKRTSSNWYSTSKYFVQPAPTSSACEVNFQIVETSMLPQGVPVTTETSTVISQQTQTPVIIEPPVRVQVATVQIPEPPAFVYFIEMASKSMNCAVNYMTVDQPIQVKVTAQQMSEQIIQYATQALVAGQNLASLQLSLTPTVGNTLVFLATSWGGVPGFVPPAGLTALNNDTFNSGQNACRAWSRVVELDDPQTWEFSLSGVGTAIGSNFAVIEIAGEASLDVVDGTVVNSADQVEAAVAINGVAVYGSLALWLIEWNGPTDCTLTEGATSSIPNQYAEPQDVEVLQSFGLDPAHGVALVASLNPQDGEQLELTLNDTPTGADVFIAFVANIPGPVELYVGELGDDESQCTVLSSSTDASNKSGAALSFFSNDIPAPQSKLLIQYREAGLALARVVDNGSIASEAARFGDNGVRAGLQTQFDPQAYSSMEIETRLQAMLDDLTEEHFQGTWASYVPREYTFSAEPRPGVFAMFQVPTRLPLGETVAQQVFLEDAGGNASVELNLTQVPDTGNQLVAMVTGEFSSITPPAGFVQVSHATGSGGIAVSVFQKAFVNGYDGKSYAFIYGGSTAGVKNWALFELANVAQVSFATGVPTASGTQLSTADLATNLAAQQVSVIAMFACAANAPLASPGTGYTLLADMLGAGSAAVVESDAPVNGAKATVTYVSAPPAATVYAVMVIAFDETLLVLPQTVTTEVVVEEPNGTEVMKHTLEFGEFTSLRLDELLVKFNAQTISPQAAQISQTQKLAPLDTNLVGTTFCADLPNATLVGQSESLYTIDIGVDLNVGQAVEIRTSDFGWGTGAGTNLIGWSYLRQFDVPRNSRQQTVYLKLLEVSSWSPPAGIISRFPAVLRMTYPLIPQPPAVNLYDQSDFLHPVFQATITSAPEDVFEVQWAVGSSGQIVFTTQYTDPDNLLFTYDNVDSLWTQTIYCRFINLLGEASAWTTYAMVIPYPTVWDLAVDESTGNLTWTTDPYSSEAFGAVTFGAPGISVADPATAIELNVGGLSGYIEAPPGDWFTPEFSLEIWVYPTSAAAHQYVFWSGSTAGSPLQNTVELYWADAAASQPGVRITGGVNGQVLLNLTAPSALALNAWHHLAVTFDGANLTLYVDGSAVATAEITGSLPIVQRPLTYFGKRQSAIGYPDNLFQGSVARFAIYEYVLTATQIANHFGAQLFATYSVDVENDAPIGYLIMGDSGEFGIVANEMAVLNPNPTNSAVTYEVQISDASDFSDFSITPYSGSMGPYLGSYAASTGSGPGWQNPTNATLGPSGGKATITLTVPNGTQSGWLTITGFKFPLLDDEAQITGLQVTFQAQQTGGTSATYMSAQLAGIANPVTKGDVYGSPVGGSVITRTYGGEGDTWNTNQLTGALLNSGAFGVSIAAGCTGAPGNGVTATVWNVQIQIWFNDTEVHGLDTTTSVPYFNLTPYPNFLEAPFYFRVRALWNGGEGPWATLSHGLLSAAVPTEVQYAKGGVNVGGAYGSVTLSGTTATLTLGATPTVGNTLIFIVGGSLYGGNLGNVTPYQVLDNIAEQAELSLGMQIAVYMRVVQGGDTAAWSFEIEQVDGFHSILFYAVEVAGGASVSAETCIPGVTQTGGTSWTATLPGPVVAGSGLVYAASMHTNNSNIGNTYIGGWSPSFYLAEATAGVNSITAPSMDVAKGSGTTVASNAIVVPYTDYYTGANLGVVIVVVPNQTAAQAAPTSSQTSFTASGDLSGTNVAQTVTGIQGVPVATTTPINGQALVYDSTTGEWTPGSGVGTRGSLWYTGSGAPGSIGGQLNGDWYINETNGDIWELVSGTWTKEGNILGPAGSAGAAGTRGSLWYTGSGAPGSIAGQLNGDWYLDTSTGYVYELLAGVWTLEGAISGRRGSEWYSGAGAPGSISGQQNNDLYVDSNTANLYELVSGTWTFIMNIMGPQGNVEARGSVALTTAAVANQANVQGTVLLGKSFAIDTITVSCACRVRIYSNSTFQAADLSRPASTPPAYGTQHGVILDIVLNATTGLSWVLSPLTYGAECDPTNTGYINYTIQNLSGVTQSGGITVSFTRTLEES